MSLALSFPRRLPSPRRAATLAALLVACLAGTASAQRNPLARVDKELMKESPALLALGEGVARTAADATVRIYVGDDLVDFGTVVRPDGFVLTKASELGDDFRVALPDGRRVGGRLVGVARENDLALLKIDVSGLAAVTFDAAAVDAAEAGTWLVSPGSGEGDALAVGNLSVKGLRRIPPTTGLLGVRPGPPTAGIPVYRVDADSAADRGGVEEGDLIVAVDGAPVGTMRAFTRQLQYGAPDAAYDLTLSRAGQRRVARVQLLNGRLGVTLATEAAGVVIDQVSVGSGAQEAGLRVGDVITAVGDTPVRQPETLFRVIQQVRPGDAVDVTFLRNGDEQTVSATIGYRTGRSPRGDLQNSFGTTLSNRAVDFPAVIQHDSILNANQMGGPLVDLQGRVLGINIARAGRVETYALPAQVIAGVLPQLMSGKMPTATAPASDESGQAQTQEPLRRD